ncbi:MAG TPA: KGG domain-containing protein [Thermoanaerobaculia bacterium]|nr:KGG domain-containing protein [Thermoanaerobaculia bacterium]
MAQTSSRGFASMNPDKQKEIARKGGRAAHAKGTAHEFTPDEARAAGRKGGEAVSQNRAHMAEIGRRGGERRGAKRAALRSQGVDLQTDQPLFSERPRPIASHPFSERSDRELELGRNREQR